MWAKPAPVQTLYGLVINFCTPRRLETRAVQSLYLLTRFCDSLSQLLSDMPRILARPPKSDTPSGTWNEIFFLTRSKVHGTMHLLGRNEWAARYGSFRDPFSQPKRTISILKPTRNAPFPRCFVTSFSDMTGNTRATTKSLTPPVVKIYFFPDRQ